MGCRTNIDSTLTLERGGGWRWLWNLSDSPNSLLTASRVSPEILEDTFQFDVTTIQLLAYNLLDPFVYISIIFKYTVLRDSHEDLNNSTSK